MSIPEANINIPAAMLPHVIVPFPTEITVHLGLPDDASALNVTVPFIDYVKNVASSELYPTWPVEALRANILAITSIARNRVFTEYYRQKGYDFDITNTTQYDQAYVHERGIFSSISDITNELFDQYIVRYDHIEPLFAAFCDGRKVQCDGLQQWGSVDLANQGFSAIDILQYYYGDNIIIIENSLPAKIMPTYPGTPLEIGDSGINVFRMQHSLNRISANYPSIPKINITGYFDDQTENAVRKFQTAFKLPSTGIVDEATWDLIRRIYNAVTGLSELNAEGLISSDLINLYSNVILEGDTRPVNDMLQYFLNVLSVYYPTVPAITIDGYYGPETTAAVKEFQKAMNLTQSGLVDQITWNVMYRTVYNILTTLSPEEIFIPIMRYMGINYIEGMGAIYPGIFVLKLMLNYLSTRLPEIPFVTTDGIFDTDTTKAVLAFQNLYNLEPTGVVDETTWNSIVTVYQDLKLKSKNETSV